MVSSIVTQILPLPSVNDVGACLFTDDILDAALDIIETRHLGKHLKKSALRQIVMEVRRTIREIFLNQAKKRNLNPHGIGELADKLVCEIEIVGGNLHLHINSEIIPEMDRFLCNQRCQVCGMKLPGAHHHNQEECDNYLVEDLMSE